MIRKGWLLGGAVAALVAGLWWRAEAAPPERLRRPPTPAPSPSGPFVPKFEALAETRLLMEGMTQPNYLSLAQFLKEKPDAETWKFARGQALLIAEAGNLLLLRPPRNEGRDTWFKRAMEMRQAAGNLARELGSRDLERSRGAFTALTTSCNRCHQTFRVPVKVTPNPEPPPPEKAPEKPPEKPPEKGAR